MKTCKVLRSENCSKCEALTIVWEDEDGKRWYETHYKDYPVLCDGIPEIKS